MRILHVIPWLAPRFGGPAIAVPQESVALAERGHRVEIITTNADRPGVLDIPTGNPVNWAGAFATFHPRSFPSRFVTSWPMLADLRRRALTFDVVHIHYLYRFHGLAAAMVARSQGIPYVVQAHGSLDPWHRQQKRRAKNLYHAFIEDRVISGASALICTSFREQSSVRALGYSVPTYVIPMGINAEDLRQPSSPEGAVTTGTGRDARLVTFLGRISEKKGVPLLVEAFRITAAAFPNAHLIVAGPDDEGIGRGMARLIAEAGLIGRVSFPGVLDGAEKRALLQRSDVFVLPSADESFGIAVAEAMAVGCPVVVSPEVALQDVVRATGAGLVVNRNPAAIAEAMATILGDPALARAMGAAGSRAADERFSWPSVARELESMYEAIVTTAGNRSRRRDAFKHSPSESVATAEPYFACPRCDGELMTSAVGFTCESCGWVGSTIAGIPVLAVDPGLAAHDELDHGHDHGHKAAQAAHFDRPGEEEFEIDRPHGTPRLYNFLLAEKFRRAADPIRPHLVGASALTVCGGSGMDAEFLARAGASVTSSDLSLGAAKRTKARSERYGIEIRSIVADVEHLPYADQSVDLLAVHDGLHHLDDPYAGLSEMARVARRWVVVTEPARASMTGIAIRLGLAVEIEGAGNRVGRMAPTEVVAFLRARGFVCLRAERYAMYYPHHPGAVFRLLSRPLIYPVIRLGWRLANGLIGRFGNKMVVVAERVQPLGSGSQSLPADPGAT